jgi:YegS/Rv2252/BmrU family lipid kinase
MQTHVQLNIAILTNAKAGKGKGLKVAHEIDRLLSKRGISHQLFNGNWPADLTSFSDIWIAGGDGTLNYFINLHADFTRPISIFKGGTGNDFACGLYGNLSTPQQVEKVLSSSPKPVDAALCNDRLYLNVAGIGFDGEVLKEMGLIRFLGGKAGYYFAILKNILFFREKHFMISNDTLIFRGKLLLVLVTNSGTTGGGFRVSPLSSVTDGLLDLVIARPLGVFNRLRYLPMVQKGKHLPLPVISHFRGEQFTISCKRELYAQIDGDLMTAKTFRFSVLKNKFLFRY